MSPEVTAQVISDVIKHLSVPQAASDLQSGVPSHVMLDVVSLAQLRRLGVPHTDDSLKYQYTLDQDRYGTKSHLHS